MTEYLQYAVQGIPTGCVFALLAVGLVLTHKASGVFNLAFAAQAYVSAAVFYAVRKEQHWPLLPAALLAVVVVGPLLGLFLYRFLFRHLRTASSGVKLVSSLGLLVALPEIVKLWFGTDAKSSPPPLWTVSRSDLWLWPEHSRYTLDAGQVATIVSVTVAMLGLTALFKYSTLGLRMRAVVESPRMAELYEVNSTRVAASAWMLSSLLAGLSGVLLAPLFAQLNSLDFFTLLVAALAATVFARLTSIPLAFLGGILLGVLQAVLAAKLPTDSVWSAGLRPALPFLVLFVLLLARPGLSRIRDVADPLRGVDPPPAPTASSQDTVGTARMTKGLMAVAVIGGLLAGWYVLDAFWLSLVTTGLCLGVILLSITLVTGQGGMVSLCQPTFAAIGAFTTAQLAANQGMSVLLTMVIGALLAAAIGFVFALPVLRLDGVYLALATLAFALMFQNIFVPLDWVSGGSTPISVPRPVIESIDLAENRRFFVMATLLLVLVAAIVALVKRGTTGLYLDALRGSEHAAASLGVNPRRARILAFTLSAGIAGFGGGLLAVYYQQANFDQSFQFYLGLVWVVLVVTIGSRSVAAAIFAGLMFYLVPEWLNGLFEIPQRFAASHTGAIPDLLGHIRPDLATGFAFILFGVGALASARHPEGVLVAQARRAVGVFSRRRPSPPGGPVINATEPVADPSPVEAPRVTA